MGDDRELAAAVIGAGKMAYDCVRAIVARPQLGLHLVLTSPARDAAGRRLTELCREHGIALLRIHNPNDDEAVAALRDRSTVLAFNINSLAILGEPVLSAVSGAVVNFHNGPLPRYAGVNIPTWVIWNGERRHGVTWHFVSAAIDGGNILAQDTFAVSARPTASELMFQCITAGVRLFELTLDRLIGGERTGTPQHGERTYYGRDQRPNGGAIDLNWDGVTVDRFLRAYDYRPFPSPVGYPRLATDAGAVHIGRASVESSGAAGPAPTGSVSAAGNGWQIGLRDGVLNIRSLVDAAGRPLPSTAPAVRHGLRPGAQLPVAS